jgi:hypothetical protein
MSSRARAPESVIQVNAPAAQTAPEPVLPGLGDPPAGGDANESENPGNDGN